MLNDVTKRTLKSALMAGAAVATVMSVAPQAYAQDDQSKVEKVTVTGSRIPRKDYTSNSPLTTVTAQQIKDSGSTTIDQLLNTLPQVVPTLARGTNNGGGGLALVDLRGLGARVAILVFGLGFRFMLRLHRVEDLEG